jgi:hypothetical protein
MKLVALNMGSKTTQRSPLATARLIGSVNVVN